MNKSEFNKISEQIKNEMKPLTMDCLEHINKSALNEMEKFNESLDEKSNKMMVQYIASGKPLLMAYCTEYATEYINRMLCKLLNIEDDQK